MATRSGQMVLVGVGAAVGAVGLIADLWILPQSRFGRPIVEIIDDHAPDFKGLWTVGVVVGIAGLVLPIALVAFRSRHRRRLAVWAWVLFGFGLVASSSLLTGFALGIATYAAGVEPDIAAEAPWGDLSDLWPYLGIAALLVALVFAVLILVDRNSVAHTRKP